DQHKKTGCFPFIDDVAKISVDGKPIQESDIPWALMYILWNATSYPGAYGIWSLIDLIRHPSHLERIRNVQDGASYWEALENCFTETTRLHPLSSIPRSLAQDVIYEHNGQRIYLPKNALVATFPYDLNRDEADFV